jgi:copper(I)-binding protein
VNRGLRAAAIGALLLSPVALGACSAGQVAQTATQEQNLGSQADVGDLNLRALELAYPTGGVYAAGTDARLLGALVSNGETDDTLVSIEGDGFDSVEVVDPDAAEAAAAATGTGSLDLPVPAGGTVYLGNGDGPSVTLVGLTEEVGVGQYVDVTFTFEQAGEVAVQVPVGVAVRDLPRGEPFDFHEGEGEGGEEQPGEQQGGGPG